MSTNISVLYVYKIEELPPNHHNARALSFHADKVDFVSAVTRLLTSTHVNKAQKRYTGNTYRGRVTLFSSQNAINQAFIYFLHRNLYFAAISML